MRIIIVSNWLHPGRLTWNIIMEVWKIIFLSKWVICRFYVNLPGCIDRSFVWHENDMTIRAFLDPKNSSKKWPVTIHSTSSFKTLFFYILFGSSSFWVRYTLEKLIWNLNEPENTCLEKEKSLQTTNSWVQQYIFRGVSMFNGTRFDFA